MTPALTAVVEDEVSAVAQWYSDYVAPGDLAGEIRLYAVEHSDQLQRWVDAGDTFRVQAALRGAARRFGDAEKARALGRPSDEVSWFSPAMVLTLLPMALDPEWERPSAGDIAGLVLMVMGVRAAVEGRSIADFDPTTPTGQANIQQLCDRLGGDYPDAPGYRRGRHAMTNQAAQKLASVNT